MGKEQGLGSGTGRRQGSLGTGVAAADDNHIEPGWIQHGIRSLRSHPRVGEERITERAV